MTAKELFTLLDLAEKQGKKINTVRELKKFKDEVKL